MERGLVVILSGASSVGKHGIRDRLKADPELKLHYSVSITTRPPKEGEVDGGDYYFVSFKSFAEAVKNKELVEYTEFNGYYYGTPRAHLDFLLEQGKNVLLEVEAQGVGPLKLHYPDALAVFVLPRSIEDLERQINEVYGDHSASAKNRLNKAKMDMEIASLFRNTVTNDDTDLAVEQIKKLILDELAKRKGGK
jgi:guanylate kinase